MNKETNELLEKLAQKMGTTVEYLWSVLIKQAPIDAFTNLFQILLIVVFGIVLYKLHLKFSKEPEKYSNSIYSEYEEMAAVPMMIGAIVFVALAVCAFFSISDMVNGFVNPEYWALSRILSAK